MMDTQTNSTESATILVVDDNPVNLKLLSDILTANGYQVRPAGAVKWRFALPSQSRLI